jgi:hypothetical protein
MTWARQKVFYSNNDKHASLLHKCVRQEIFYQVLLSLPREYYTRIIKKYHRPDDEKHSSLFIKKVLVHLTQRLL